MTAPFDGPPLDPSSPEAQQWVRDELAKGGYLTEPSWWQRFVEWLMRLLDAPTGGAMPRWIVVLVVAALVAVVVLVVLRLVRSEAVTSRRNRGSAAAVDDEGLSAADYRRRARGAAALGDWDALLLDSYRALAASSVERTLLVELPGRTAHEVAVDLGPVFPEDRDALAAAASAFDDVRYGHRSTSEAQARAVAALDTRLLDTRPRLPALVQP